MKPRPSIYRNVLVFGAVENASVSHARIGGLWRQPNLGLSYLLAARHVLEAGERERRVNEVALPTAYLQRHAFEVAVKDLIGAARAIKADADWVTALRADSSAERRCPEAVPFIHGLDTLLRLLGEALAAIRFGEPPQVLQEMTRRLLKAERFEPARFRYLSLKRGIASFPEEERIPVVAHQEELEEVFEEVFVYREDASAAETDNLATSIAHEGAALDQEIVTIVGVENL